MISFQMPSMRLDGRVVLVTGGNRGLGLGLALALAHSGADIAIAGRTQSELDSASELIDGAPAAAPGASSAMSPMSTM